jgi:hypothetical protein
MFESARVLCGTSSSAAPILLPVATFVCYIEVGKELEYVAPVAGGDIIQMQSYKLRLAKTLSEHRKDNT